MILRFATILIALIFFNYVRAQNNGVVVDGKWSNQIFITDVNGRPFENKYLDVIGTPFFNADYKVAEIKLKQGRTFVKIKTKIDLVAQETYFITTNGIETYLEVGMVKEIKYFDTIKNNIVSFKFQTGFPPIDLNTENNFYQVLSEGRCSFLKSTSKKILEKKNELSGEVIREFETYESYYLFINGEMKKFKKDKDFIRSQLLDKLQQVDLFLNTNKIDLKNREHLVLLFNYYNSL